MQSVLSPVRLNAALPSASKAALALLMTGELQVQTGIGEWTEATVQVRVQKFSLAGVRGGASASTARPVRSWSVQVMAKWGAEGQRAWCF